MKVILTASVLRSPNSPILQLVALVERVAARRHVLEVEDEDAWEDWLANRDIMMRGELLEYRRSGDRAARNEVAGTVTIHVEAAPVQSWDPPNLILDLEGSLLLLSEPLTILLENGIHDCDFLLRIAPDPLREVLAEGIDAGWIRSEHGGGATIDDLMRSRAERPRTAVRTFVMFDSDRLHPDELRDEWADTMPPPNEHVSAQCGAWSWERTAIRHFAERYWRLRRRFIESYMPDEQLRTWCDRDVDHEGRPFRDRPGRQRAYEAFCRLTDAQRWHFNMKGGFQKDHQHARHRELYDNLRPEQRMALLNGFGRDLSTWYSPIVNPTPFTWDAQAREEAEEALLRLLRVL